ncbi:MAG: N-acetylmuramoyl-L-alanine amidase [Kouleothrix sp.]|nr:N-acetylmuramoyl-L-alanine amidase [Kouleothrix sp.]
MTEFEVHKRAAPASASAPRRDHNVQLIVLHSDLGSAPDSIAAFSAPRSASAPHYYVDANGQITQLVSEKRAARHSGSARWEKRTRNIDLISVGIMLEHRLDGGAGSAQLAALQWLLDALLVYFALDEDAVVRWQPAIGGQPLAALSRYFPPQPPAPAPARPTRAATRAAGAATLGLEDDPLAAQRLWLRLQDLTHKQRGGAFHIDWSFHLHAAKFDLGAPLAPSDPTQIQPAGDPRSYGYQPFARDTICNEGRNWDQIQSLNSLLGASVAPTGLARALVDASYRSSLAVSESRVAMRGNNTFQPGWKFHQVALQEHLGAPISRNYATADGLYAVQVFAGDTLYTPRAEGSGCRRLGQTAPGDPAYAPIWAETYAAIGAAYNPSSPHQQFAAANKLGAPLGPVTRADFEGTPIDIQIFALDTIYAGPDGQIKRLSALPKPDIVSTWQPAPVTSNQPPPPPPGQGAGQVPERVRRLINRAIGLLGSDGDDLAKFPELRKFAPDGDIVCADLVTICLNEAGVRLWSNVSDPTGTGRTGPRAANYYRPDAANQGALRQVGDAEPWLPGDILIYGKGDLSVDRAYHVNLYVAPFTYNGRTRDVVNSSLGDPRVLALNKDDCMRTHCSPDYRWTKRVRVVELEREFT